MLKTIATIALSRVQNMGVVLCKVCRAMLTKECNAMLEGAVPVQDSAMSCKTVQSGDGRQELSKV